MISGLDFSFTLESRNEWLALFIIAFLVYLLTLAAVYTRSKGVEEQRHRLAYGLTPTLAVVGEGLFLSTIPLESYWLVAALAIASFLVAVTILAECRSVSFPNKRPGIARFYLDSMGYLTAFAFYASFHTFKMGDFASTVAVGALSFLLAMELLRENRVSSGERVLYAAILGLVISEAELGLKYWSVGSLVGGVFLILVFYLVSGVARSHLAGTLTKGVAFEFAAVTLTGLILLYASQFWMV